MKRIFVVFVALILLFIAGCGAKYYSPPTKYAIQKVLRVELLDTSSDDEVLIHTIESEELEAFWTDFMQIKFRRYWNDPATKYGDKAIRVVYLDGWEDIIGIDINGRYNNGKSQRVGWYYLDDESDFEILFAKYGVQEVNLFD